MSHRFQSLQALGEQFELAAERAMSTSPSDRRSVPGGWLGSLPTALPWLSRLTSSGRRISAVFLAGLITVGSVAAAITLTSPHTDPVRLPNGQSLCPLGFPYLAYSRLGLVYPPNYPGAMPDARGTACYVSLQDARDAGFQLAATPRGDSRLGPVYVGPAPIGIRRTCQNAQRLTHTTVLCPSRLPTPWLGPAINWDCPTADCGAPLLSLTGTFTVPPSYVGSFPGIGVVTISAATQRQQREFPYLVFGCGVRARPVGTALVHGRPASWYACSVFGHASVLEWRYARETYLISGDGPRRLRMRLIKYIADHLVPVTSLHGGGHRRG